MVYPDGRDIEKRGWPAHSPFGTYCGVDMMFLFYFLSSTVPRIGIDVPQASVARRRHEANSLVVHRWFDVFQRRNLESAHNLNDATMPLSSDGFPGRWMRLSRGWTSKQTALRRPFLDFSSARYRITGFPSASRLCFSTRYTLYFTLGTFRQGTPQVLV